MCRSKFVTDTDIVKNCHCNHVTLKIRETRAVEAQFQIKVPDPYPLVKRRTDFGVLVVLPLSIPLHLAAVSIFSGMRLNHTQTQHR